MNMLFTEDAVVVQDLATRRARSCPNKTESAQEAIRSVRIFLHLEENPRSVDTGNSLEFIQACEELNCES